MDINILATLQSIFKAIAASPFFHFLRSFGIFAFLVLLIADILLLSKRMRGDWNVAFYGAKVPSLKKSKYTQRWEAIKKHLATGNLSNAKIAVIEADLMFGETLEKIGYEGLDTGERLAKVRPGQLIGLEEAIASHEQYKKIVRDAKYEVDFPEIQTALDGYEKVFRGLELLD